MLENKISDIYSWIWLSASSPRLCVIYIWIISCKYSNACQIFAKNIVLKRPSFIFFWINSNMKREFLEKITNLARQQASAVCISLTHWAIDLEDPFLKDECLKKLWNIYLRRSCEIWKLSYLIWGRQPNNADLWNILRFFTAKISVRENFV